MNKILDTEYMERSNLERFIDLAKKLEVFEQGEEMLWEIIRENTNKPNYGSMQYTDLYCSCMLTVITYELEFKGFTVESYYNCLDSNISIFIDDDYVSIFNIELSTILAGQDTETYKAKKIQKYFDACDEVQYKIQDIDLSIDAIATLKIGLVIASVNKDDELNDLSEQLYAVREVLETEKEERRATLASVKEEMANL